MDAFSKVATFFSGWVLVAGLGCNPPVQRVSCPASVAASPAKPELILDARVDASSNGRYLVVKLSNPARSLAGAWVNGQFYGETSGSLQVTIRTGGYGDSAARNCVDDERLPSASSYRLLRPGESVEERIDLNCYQLVEGRFSAEVMFRDRYSEPPPVPSDRVFLIQGPIIFGPSSFDLEPTPDARAER
jgi:hypothetical protein